MPERNGKKNTDVRPRVLAPVGGREQLLAAVRCGADSVYFGAKGFNARQNAENFGGDDLAEAIAYCHAHGVRVYITLNTLVTDAEVPALIESLDRIAAAGADALIVQDLFVASLAKLRHPDLPLVASTQTAVHNAEGVHMMEKLGFSQAVLARELSIAEMRQIRSETSIELEAFVHGALCMCLSGSCYLSSMIGTRSGNRGLCAQPCRLNFKLNGRDHALSLKDMTAIPHIEALRDAGITELKIEGRMKRPEYVAAAVSACRAAVDGEEPDMDTLAAVFSRSGFTDGYLTAKRGIHMFGTRTKEDVKAAGDVLPRLAASYAKEVQHIPVDFALRIRRDEPASLTVTDGIHTVTVAGVVPEPARAVAISEESVKKNLLQTGNTPYYVKNFCAEIDEGLSLPVSAQKTLRRAALETLEAKRIALPMRRFCDSMPKALPPHCAPETPALRLRFETAEQSFDLPEAEKILLPVGEIAKHMDCIAQYGEKLIGELPALCFPTDLPKLQKQLEQLKAGGLKAVHADNIGLVGLAQKMGFRVHGGPALNILNSGALELFRELGLADATVSFELAMKQIAALSGTLPRGIVAYGYLPLMRVRACPAQGKNGCGDCTGINELVDEKRERFPLLCRERRYQELCNSVPLYLGDKRIRGADFVVLHFTTESKAEAMRIAQMFLHRESPDFRRTAGLYYRELQ